MPTGLLSFWLHPAVPPSRHGFVLPLLPSCGLTLSPRPPGDGAACALCDKIMVTILSGEAEGGAGTLVDVDCNSLCWRFKKCTKMCIKIINALTHSTKFPCVAAGYCPQVDDVGVLPRCKFRFPSSCEPANICTFKFPKCRLSEGYKKWRQIDAVSPPPSLGIHPSIHPSISLPP